MSASAPAGTLTTGGSAAAGAVVVTGLGVLSPNGLGTQRFWEATVAGHSGIGRITRFDPAQYPAKLAGEIRDFDAGAHLSARLLPQTDRMTRLALVAADWAFQDAGIDPAALPEYAAGVTTASSSGGFEFGHRELEKLWSLGSEHVSAYQSFAWFYAVNSGQISIRHGLRGPSGVLVSDQAGGLDAVAQARRQVRASTPVMMTGGVDASICPWGWVAQLAAGGLSGEDDPARAYLPFDRAGHGHVPGEGGALLVLEEAGKLAGRTSYGEIAGYGATFDPRPGSDRPPGLARAVRLALADAGVTPDEVDVVFADASGHPGADARESAALAEVFGPYGVPVTAPKTMTGRLHSGAAPLDLATALLTIRHGVIPPTANVTDPHPDHRLDLVVGTARAARVRIAVILARGAGGFNSALVVRASDETATGGIRTDEGTRP